MPEPASIPIRFGRESMVPRKLDRPDSSAMALKLMILPSARELLFMGVTSRVAMVPLSFSPAMDSGATAIQPLNRKIINSMGSIMENI